MKIDTKFNQEQFLNWMDEFLPNFQRDIKRVDVHKKFQGVTNIVTLGESSIGVRVFVIQMDSDPIKKRITITKDSFNILKNHSVQNALIAYYSLNHNQWRLSLLTSTAVWEDNKVISKLSNLKRQSFVLGEHAKVNTPIKFLISKGNIIDFEDLKNRFSIEVVNKDFYKEVSHAFTRLVGGIISIGKSKTTHEAQLKLPSSQNHGKTNLEFAVRLIGRVIFCWFLREKKSLTGHSLMPQELLSHKAVIKTSDYYHQILEPIFFEVLNRPIRSRKESYSKDLFGAIPYLNGGLFSPHEDDFYSGIEGRQAINHNTVIVPDNWFRSFFEVLETYNFTIDENTSFDEELSIDPEMLGRIFENLLAEINPETGDSARKSTGSYYTPRKIVDYMIDESLYLYLKEKTNINEQKLRSLISYDLEDDALNPLIDEDKEKVTQALSIVKILDPACGSGAFPIGALQKIVFILQQIDPNGKLWFKRQIRNTPTELKRLIEREFEEKNFDYLRKLSIIRENIYGVDIQPIATEISRLRCFLTLVVDERIVENLENRGIEPLPNLDFKFVTANALINLPQTGTDAQVGMFEDDMGISELKEIRDMFFNASGFERDQLKLQFVQTQNKMFQKLVTTKGMRGHAELTSKLTSWDPFSHKSSDWFDSEWMFGIKDGFDIVIANPPYVTTKYGKINDEEKDAYKKIYISAYDKIDLYVLFIEQGIKLAKVNGGLNTMITPWNFLQNFYSFKIRKYILDNCRIILFNKLPPNAFDSAIVDNIIFVFQKATENVRITNTILFDDLLDAPKRKYLAQSIYMNNDKYLFELPVDKGASAILKKMRVDSESLGKIALNYIGIMTGGQKTMIANEPIFENSKPVLSGKEIDRWFYKDIGKYVNFDKSKIHSNDNESVYLAKRKILLRKTGKNLVACLDEKQFYSIQSLYNIVIREKFYKEEYILALLNSKLFTYIYNNFFITNPEVFPYIKRRHLDMLPIKKASTEMQKAFINIVNILQAVWKNSTIINPINMTEIKGYEKQIDQMVYKLYGLIDEEIKIVEEEND